MVELKRAEIVGAGPAGLYAAILLKTLSPDTSARVSEQNPADATFGFGVVFSQAALDFLQADDPDTHALITPRMQRWQNMTLSIEGERVTLDGIGFAAIGRLDLLRVLQRRAQDAGVELRFEYRVEMLDDDVAGADLFVGADGLNSVVRAADEAAFAPRLEHFSNRFAWFGTPRVFDNLTQTFVTTGQGVLNAHHYRYSADMSTFIVECDAQGFEAHGFATMGEAESAACCARYFADTLEGAPLLTNRSEWRRFPRLWCENWVAGNRVLLGDAAHTAHFSIGSGTRLALEDAIALVKSLSEHAELDAAFADFQQKLQPIARKIVDGANTSARWYEDFRRHMNLPAMEFAYSYLTRSGRVDDARLRELSPRFMAQYEDYRQRRL